MTQDPSPAPDLAAQMQAAAESLRRAIQEQKHLDLGYDEVAVRWLDAYIEQDRLRPSDESARARSIHVIGAFLGECLIRSSGGQWARHDGMTGVAFSEGNMAFPHHKVARHYQHGAAGGDSILGFYQGNKALVRAFTAQPLTPGQQRLLAFSRDSRHRIFVRSTHAGDRPQWVLVTQVADGQVQLHAPAGQRYTVTLPLSDIQSFYVCSPVLTLLHAEWINQSDWDSLPPDILRQIRSRQAADRSLTLEQLASGEQFVEVSYGPSDKPDDEGHRYYATTLRNISPHRIRITRFGGFKPAESAWQLGSVTGDFYTADDFRDWYQQKAEWLQPGESVCDNANWGQPPVLWAYFGVTESGESFVAGRVLEKPVASAASGSGAHFVRPLPPQPELEQVMAKLRAGYEARQQRMSDLSLASVLGPMPHWMTRNDGLWEFFERQKLLLTEGRIVWGGLVQANTLLFEPGDANCPALLVHSPDDYFDARPHELRLIGHTFFSFKHTEPADPELRAVARLVTDEMDRSMGFELPRVFSSRPVRSATFMVFRKHIPNGVLSAGVFPILTHPSTQAVMMVPFEFWPIELILLWKQGRL